MRESKSELLTRQESGGDEGFRVIPGGRCLVVEYKRACNQGLKVPETVYIQGTCKHIYK